MYRGRWWYRNRLWQPLVGAPKGYIYIGPCRCGTGPMHFTETKVVAPLSLFARRDIL